jgi:hypothetical protein
LLCVKEVACIKALRGRSWVTARSHLLELWPFPLEQFSGECSIEMVA